MLTMRHATISTENGYGQPEAINRYCKTETDFSSITNVDAPEGETKGDMQESFVFAEVMKYVYLSNLEVRIRA